MSDELLKEAFEETGKQLTRISDAYERKFLTTVTYADGNVVQYNIVGMLSENSIPNKENATEVEIGNTVTSIGNDVFNGCSWLTSITIPDSVTSIGDTAFSNCSGLTSVTIPDSVTSIGEYAFYRCSGLMSVTIPDSVTRIGGHAFNGCSGLTSVTIPDGVTSIESSAFYGCHGLFSVMIPDSVTFIGDSAFSDCSHLTSVTFEGKTIAEVQAMAYYAWYVPVGIDLVCTDGTISAPDSGGDDSGSY